MQKALLGKTNGLWKTYDALGVLNQVIPHLLKQLLESYAVSVSMGWETKAFREAYGLPKAHCLDVYAIACSRMEGHKVQAPDGCRHIR